MKRNGGYCGECKLQVQNNTTETPIGEDQVENNFYQKDSGESILYYYAFY